MDATAAAVPEAERRSHHASAGLLRRNRHLLLLAPGVIWMVLFLIVPLGMMVYVSFWTQTTFSISSDLTTRSWETFFASETYFAALMRTLRLWLIVLALTFVIGYPTALFIGQYVTNKTTQTVLLVACVIPFWTSFLIRVLAWRPMLGREGAVNIVLEKLGLISQPIEVLLFTELSVIKRGRGSGTTS
ncbi:MAG: ABC transporter permease, partial [Pseudomonadota bacterium]